MKRLTKKELKNLIHDNMRVIARQNIDTMTQNISKSLEGINDFNIAIVNAMAVYGAEIEKECCQTVAETLYEILYSEDEDNLKGENIK